MHRVAGVRETIGLGGGCLYGWFRCVAHHIEPPADVSEVPSLERDAGAGVVFIGVFFEGVSEEARGGFVLRCFIADVSVVLFSFFVPDPWGERGRGWGGREGVDKAGELRV